jgi:recombination protein RecT
MNAPVTNDDRLPANRYQESVMSDTDVVVERPANPVAIFAQQVKSREQEFAAVLPAHIPAARYVRVILTAVNKNPALLYADRASLFSAAMMAATDGLLCDGREAALVIYRTKKKDQDGNERWIDAVQYMPMVAGILKKVRNSGELSSIVAKVVYAGDRFRNWIDNEGEHLDYEAGESQERDIVRCAFAMAKLRDGSIEVEVLKPADIEKIRSISRSKDKGPWVEWWEEMAKKSAIRRLSKRLPLNTDVDDLIRRDDALYDFEGAKAAPQVAQVHSLAGRLDRLAALPSHDAVTGEITEPNSGAETSPPNPAAPEAGSAPPDPAINSASTPSAPPADAASGQVAASDPPRGAAAAAPKESPFTRLPKTEAEYATYARAWIKELTDIDEGNARLKSEKDLRNKANVSGDMRETLKAELEAKQAEIRDADRN